MSCVVGLRTPEGAYIGGDSISCMESQVEKRVDPKVFCIGGRVVIGFVGSWRAGQLIATELVLPRKTVNVSPREWVTKSLVPRLRRILVRHRLYTVKRGRKEFDASFLIGIKGEFYRVDEELAVAELVNTYDAIGAGAEFAMGAMHSSKRKAPAKRIVAALAAAAHHSPWVQSPWKVYFVPKEGPAVLCQ